MLQNIPTRLCYNAGMEVIGLLYLVILFAACFAAVHIVRLAWLGFKASRKKPENKEPPKEQPQPQSQPVYYIVEKKRQKKANYSSPREIKFTDDK